MEKSGRKWNEHLKEVKRLLIGEYEHSIDTKGRLIMPSKLKEDIGEKFVVTKGLDGCLFVYSQTEWKTFEDKLRAFPLTNKDARALVRFFLAGAMECEIDKQGRIKLSSELCEKCSITKDVVVIGVDDHVEIWDREQHKEMSKRNDDNYEAYASKISYGE